MPWYITQSKKCPANKPWALISRASGRIMGCHATKESARAQQGLLYAKQSRGEIK
jgi:hypothetical protein